MPPFQYAQYRNPYVGSLSELLQAGPRVRAEAALTAASARARAAEIGGQVRASTAQNIGQIVTGSLGDLARYREQAPQREMNAITLTAARQAAADAPAIRAQAIAAQQDEEAGKLGFRLSQDPTLEGLTRVLTDALSRQQLAGDEAQQLYDLAASDPPKIPKLARDLMARSPTYKDLIGKVAFGGAPGAPAYDPLTREPLPALTTPEKPVAPSRAGFAAIANDPTKTPAERAAAAATLASMTVPATQSPPAVGSLADYLTRYAKEHGKPAAELSTAEIATATKQHTQATQRAPATPGVNDAPLVPAGTLTLAEVPQADRAYIEGMLEYRLPMPTGYALARSPVWMRRVDLAAGVDPTFDVTQYATRQAARKDFNSGKSAQNLRGLNTAVGHIDSLVKASAALENTAAPDFNAIMNFLAQHVPVTADLRARQGTVTGVKTTFNAVKGELASIFKQSGATDQEIASWGSTIGEPSTASPTQWKAFIDGALTLMGSRIEALRHQYEVAMGKPPAFKMLSAKSRTILSRLGVEVDTLDPPTGGPAASRRASQVLTDPETGKQYDTSTWSTEDLAQAKARGWK